MGNDALLGHIDVSTRRKRRRAVKLAIALLEQVRSAEEAHIEALMPETHGGDVYANAEDSLYTVVDAILMLSDAY